MTPDLPPQHAVDLPGPVVEMHGDMHVTGTSDGAADLRMRLAPEIRPVRELSVHAIGDLRATYGDDPAELVPVAAWGVARTPVGELHLGRMPIPLWGLGLVANPGGCLDCLSDTTVDRVGFGTELLRHAVGASWDAGPDGLGTGTLLLGSMPTDAARKRALDADKSAWGYGLWSSWRTRADIELNIGLVDGWARFEHGDLRVEVEGVFLRGRIDQPISSVLGVEAPAVGLQQGGGALQVQWRWLAAEAGVASGDTAPGRGVNGEGQLNPPEDVLWSNLTIDQNHRIDRLHWRRDVGALTDTTWIRPSLTLPLGDRLSTEAWYVHSAPVVQTAEASADELGLTARWNPWRGLQLRSDAALLLSGDSRVEGYVAWLF
jgi:hypothetical protein